MDKTGSPNRKVRIKKKYLGTSERKKKQWEENIYRYINRLSFS